MNNFDTLVDATTLAGKLHTGTDGNNAWVIIDTRFSLADTDYGRHAYETSHIPGAHYMHLDEDLSSKPVAGDGRHPLPDVERFCRLLGSFGIDATTQVVVYDDVGGGIAGRLWWLLRFWLGHQAVAVLDGDFRNWVACGYETSRSAPKTTAGRYPGTQKPQRLATLEEITEISEASNGEHQTTIVDARARLRFRGEEEPIDPVAGHIPGAKCYPLTDNLTDDGRFLDPDTLKDRFRDLGDPRNVVHSCGSGVSACHNLLAMEIAGLSGSRLYVGSFSEWVADRNRPVATGEEPTGEGTTGD